VRQKVHAHFTAGDGGPFGAFSLGGEEEAEGPQARIDVNTIPHPTVEALAALGLEAPVTWAEVKARYKTLAKRYHPDTNKQAGAEELFKKINLSYTILKLSWQHYTQLDER
jgi:hypothetical protein